MQVTIPHYYREFSCIAADCPDTCCAGWQIVIDDKTRKKYKKLKGPFGNRLHNSIDWKESSFCRYHQRCAFLNEDNLCDIYIEAGPELLCRTCRNYPRHIEEYEGLREISLSLSCPEAARIILSCREPVRFLYGEKETKEEQYKDFDCLLFDKLLDARDIIVRILQNRETDIRVRTAMILAFGHDLQQRIDRQRIFETDVLFERYGREYAPGWFENRLRKYENTEQRQDLQRRMFEQLDGFEVLRKDWPDYTKHVRNILFETNQDAYKISDRKFQQILKETEDFSIQTEQILVYFIFTYFCGAVYDGNAYSKVKMAVVSSLWIGDMVQAYWVENASLPEFAELTRIVWRYSRELEHSAPNLQKIEEILSREELFSLENLLRVL